MEKEYCDVLVVGSGAGGLAAAVTIRQAGLRVIVVEKSQLFGGTSARSSGWLWIPNNPVAKRAGIEDSADAARDYLRHEAGNHFDADRVDAFLANGPRMVDFFERKTKLAFEVHRDFADYHPDAPGASQGGRAICATPYEAQELGDELKRMGVPVNEMTFFGLMLGTGKELMHFFNARRSLKSLIVVLGLLLRYAQDKFSQGRRQRLTSGAALIGRLAKSAFDSGVKIWTSARPLELITEEDSRGTAIRGAVVERQDGPLRVIASRGVILAAGGFSHDLVRRQLLYPHSSDGGGHWSAAVEESTGDGLQLGLGMGGALTENLPNAAAWVPVSRVPKKDGGFTVFPHFVDRGKPGIIAVNPDGRRFTNEANSCHDFAQDMIRASEAYPEKHAWMIADHRAIRHYGLGAVKPFPASIAPYLESGYAIQGESMADLGEKIGIAQSVLVDSVIRFNQHVRNGEDVDFKRGGTVYNHSQGDPGHKPNPCLGTLETPPYYAVKLVPGDIGTFVGLNTNAHAQVLNEQNEPIRGLYAVGNDMGSIMGGSCPGPGASLGPAMTFGFIAGCHICGRDPDELCREAEKAEEASEGESR